MRRVNRWALSTWAVLALVSQILVMDSAVAGEGGGCPSGKTYVDGAGCVEEQTDNYEGQIPGDGGETTIPVVQTRNGEPPRCYQNAAQGHKEIPCTNEHGWWNGTCYVQEVSQASLPMDRRSDYKQEMKEHDGEGTVISCYYPSACDSPEDVRNDPDAYLLQCPVLNWAPDAEPVDPAQAAENLLASLTKRGIDVGVVPYDRPGYVGYVGLPSWYWVEDPEEATIGPMEVSDSSRGFTIVADTYVEYIEFDLGNGVVLECPPDSLAYEPDTGMEDRYPEGSPDCGHVFTEQGTYDIVARSHWVESWAGLGQAGTMEFELESDVATIRIGELQVLSQ